MHAQARVLAREPARSPRMVEVDVREKEVPQILELDAARAEPGLQRVDARRRAAVEQSHSFVGLDEIGADDALGAEVSKIERFRGAKRARPTGRARSRGRRRDPPATR